MSYEFIKLSEVEKVSTVSNANILIEENGEIKRISTQDLDISGDVEIVSGDWLAAEGEPGYIANKPSTLTSVINYTSACGTIYAEGIPQTVSDVINAWNNGTPMRYNNKTVIDITYFPGTGSYSEGFKFFYVNESSINTSESFYN